MRDGSNVKWWEWLLLAAVIRWLIPARGRRWEWLVLAGILSPFL